MASQASESDACGERLLSEEEIDILKHQDSRLVPPFKANKLELEARKHWDLFYKRNEARFFKDRHWTTREFQELLGDSNSLESRILLEVGCGVGNFIFPLVEENLNFKIIACDLSPRAIELVKSNPLYNENVTAFVTDITTTEILNHVEEESVDIITLIFVLSAIHPDKFISTLRTLRRLLKPEGVILFRDYGLYDMAQLRFKPGHKIAENFYMRQDGTRCYYFSTSFANEMFVKAGLNVISNTHIHRRTVNKKENIDVPRIFIQCKVTRSADGEKPNSAIDNAFYHKRQIEEPPTLAKT